MNRVGSLAGVNSQWFTLAQGVAVKQPFTIMGDPSERQGGIVFYDIEVNNKGPAGVQLQFNHDYPAQYCTATPDNLPYVWNPPQGASRVCIPVMLANVADWTMKKDAPMPPILPATVTASMEMLQGPANLVQVKIHISGIFVRLSTGTGTDAPWC